MGYEKFDKNGQLGFHIMVKLGYFEEMSNFQTGSLKMKLGSLISDLMY